LHILFFKSIQVCSPLLSCFDSFCSSLGVSKDSRTSHNSSLHGCLVLLVPARAHGAWMRVRWARWMGQCRWRGSCSLACTHEVRERGSRSSSLCSCSCTPPALALGGCARGVPAGRAALSPFLASACGDGSFCSFYSLPPLSATRCVRWASWAPSVRARWLAQAAT
jgi:hypothetical protein